MRYWAGVLVGAIAVAFKLDKPAPLQPSLHIAHGSSIAFDCAGVAICLSRAVRTKRRYAGCINADRRHCALTASISASKARAPGDRCAPFLVVTPMRRSIPDISKGSTTI